MMKRVIFSLLLLVGFATPVHADTTPTVVLIDGGVNSALFPNNVAYEVCTIEYANCANGKPFMEGVGSAQQAPSPNAEANHGSQMLSIMVKVNPNVKVIPIKIFSTTPLGNPIIYSLASVKNALDWTVANREKFNVSVVSLSQGAIFTDCKVPAGLKEDIAILKANNVPVVVATGNNNNRTTMQSPACLPDTISVGATDNPSVKSGFTWEPTAKPTIATYSNGNAQTTLYSNARYIVTNLDGTTKFMVGTSNSTAAVASWISTHKGVDFNSTYQTLVSSATGTATNTWLTGKYLFIN